LYPPLWDIIMVRPLGESGTKFDRFRGIDNISDITELMTRNGVYLTEGWNIDIDDDFQIRSAGGFERIIPGESHSLWGVQDFGLFINNGQLKRLNKDKTIDFLLDVDPNLEMDYTWVPGAKAVFYTNNQIIGFYYNGKCYSFPITVEPYKVILPPGHLLEYFNSRLYVASDEIIRFSDVSALYQFDKRMAVIPMPGKITMMKSVKDGMYVSILKDGTYFFQGKDVLDFTADKFTDAVAFLYSAIRVEGDELTQGKGVGNIVIWASAQGMFIGYPGGEVRNVSWNHYLPDDVAKVAAIYRTDLDYSQYIATYTLEGEQEINVKIPTPRVESIGESNL
jgi:hypothetical protein